MNYEEEDKEDKKYKKGYGRKEFKKDVQEAVEPIVKGKKAKKKPAPKSTMLPEKLNKKRSRSSYSKMSTKELRKLLTDKKKTLLKKSGFPESGLPRSKEEMVSLCMKLKRKRW